MFNGKIHYKWPFSIAMLNCQRVNALDEHLLPMFFNKKQETRNKQGESLATNINIINTFDNNL